VGHSGGALIDKNAALVGMILADQPPFGRAMNLLAVLELVDQWGYEVLLRPGSLDGSPFFHEAAKRGDADAIKSLLTACGDINERDDLGAVPLHWATTAESNEGLSLLLKAGSNLEAADSNGKTPLQWAVERQNTGGVRLLLKAGAKVNAQDRYGNTPLHLGTGSIEILKLLVTSGANVNALNKDKERPLTNALDGEYISADERPQLLESVRFLVASGAKVEATALFNLVKKDEVDVVRILLKAVVDLNALIYDPSNNMTDREGTLLQFATSLSELEIVDLLLKAGADVNAPGSQGETPLYVALQRDEPAIQDLLIAHGGRIKSGHDRPLNWLLTDAVEKRRPEVIKVVIAGISTGLNIYSDLPGRLLHQVIDKEDEEMARALINAGADLNAIVDNETPLQHARRKGLANIEKLLLEGRNPRSRPTRNR